VRHRSLIQRALAVAAVMAMGGFPLSAAPRLTDAQIRRLLIERSIATYRGNCPCPYHADRRGRACGARSAWSRAGGASVYCYPLDVPQAAVDAFRAELAQPSP
jgi:hypothetical protein